MQKRSIKGMGRTRTERATRLARAMWRRVYLKRGWHFYIWPAHAMREACERAER